ncbi:protein PLANT CADMIUM RESISTANCE 12 [Prunus yedoensis var. nudiflora]|uniref:Protein PLANT CADMIUM RESISTANCE 12 n=1 Tax=Prunus yedoensis var. nudiflora TaxID=2094558 RepID=A0A314ZTR1_PRUYE|nr:protein PLANT CADMIUM RESISTANCE 12 [Prunus yedoensis var. nudiflora]
MGDLEKQETVLKKVEEEEKERFLEGNGKSVVDFDVLCSTVALQTQGKMWEGEVLDCLDDRRIALESLCCPCYRFGKNMRRAGFGPCSLQGTLHLILAVLVILNCIAFIVTKKHCFIYLAVAFTISLGTYLGYFRTQMKKKFNIRGNDSSLDDCIYHLICPCCALCQESRTLEMNNVQDGTWHGRGDTIYIGSLGEGGKSIFELQPPPIVSIKSPDP